MPAIVLALLVASSVSFEPPRLVRAPAGEVPYGARAAGIVALEATIAADGTVGDAHPVKALAPFTEPFSRTVATWAFEPAISDGTPVSSRLLVLGVFRPAMLTYPAPPQPGSQGYGLTEDVPVPVKWRIPGYPPTALGDAAVVVEVTVGQDGSAVEARVVESKAGFAESALAAARQWAFRPATRAGRPVDSRVAIAFYFRAPL